MAEYPVSRHIAVSTMRSVHPLLRCGVYEQYGVIRFEYSDALPSRTSTYGQHEVPTLSGLKLIIGAVDFLSFQTPGNEETIRA